MHNFGMENQCISMGKGLYNLIAYTPINTQAGQNIFVAWSQTAIYTQVVLVVRTALSTALSSFFNLLFPTYALFTQGLKLKKLF